MRPARLIIAAALALGFSSPIPLSTAAEGGLFLAKAKVSFSPRHTPSSPRHSIRLEGTLSIELLPHGLDPVQDSLRISAGPKVLMDRSPAAGGPWKLKQGKKLVFRSRLPSGGTERFTLDAVSGRFLYKSSRLDLEGLQAGGPLAVPVVIRIGEMPFGLDIDFEDGKGRRWKFKPTNEGPVPRLPPGWSPFGERLLASWTGSGAICFPDPGTPAPHQEVAEDWFDYQELWKFTLYGAAGYPTPPVYFGVEMVVGVWYRCAGELDLPTFEFRGDDLVVRYTFKELPRCPPRGKFFCSTYFLYAVARVPGKVIFEATKQ